MRRRCCVDTAHQRRLWMVVRRITNRMLVMRLVLLWVYPIDTYMLFCYLFIRVDALCMVICIILKLLGSLRVLPSMVACVGLVGMITSIPYVLSIRFKISILWTISTGVAIVTTTTR